MNQFTPVKQSVNQVNILNQVKHLTKNIQQLNMVSQPVNPIFLCKAAAEGGEQKGKTSEPKGKPNELPSESSEPARELSEPVGRPSEPREPATKPRETSRRTK